MRHALPPHRPVRRGRGASCLAGLLTALLAATTAEAQYTFTPIAAPGATWTNLGDINTAGQIVGSSGTAAPGWSAFLYDRSTFTPLAYPGADWTTADGLNDVGQIVGIYATSFGPRGAYRYDRGTYSPLLGPAGVTLTPTDINNRGQVVGFAYDGANVQSFLSDGGAFTLLAYPGAANTRAVGINDAGQIVGTYQTTPFGASAAFLYAQGVFSPLRLPGGAVAPDVSGINNLGQIIGSYGVFTYLADQGPVPFDIGVPGVRAGAATRINDAGLLIGTYYDPTTFTPIDPHFAGFLLSPLATPEPSPVGLVGLGLVVAGLGRWRRRASPG